MVLIQILIKSKPNPGPLELTLWQGTAVQDSEDRDDVPGAPGPRQASDAWAGGPDNCLIRDAGQLGACQTVNKWPLKLGFTLKRA